MLKLILGELPPKRGEIAVYGRISYASQEPWLFTGSVRDNIIFGEEYHEERYRRVVDVCQLSKDFELLPYGDRTLVGERGQSLSGGQCARINLARYELNVKKNYRITTSFYLRSQHFSFGVYKFFQ